MSSKVGSRWRISSQRKSVKGKDMQNMVNGEQRLRELIAQALESDKPATVRMLSLSSAADLLRDIGLPISASTLRYHAEGVRQPQLPATLIGKTWVVDPAVLPAWAKAYRAAKKAGRRIK